MEKDKSTEIDSLGNKIWKNDKGECHREDGPAIEYANGSKHWLINGEFHREDGPAIEDPNGFKVWYVNGKLHRLDGPAYEGTDGTKQYYIDGKKYNRPNFVKYLQKNNLPIPDLEDLKRYLPKDKTEDKDKPEIDEDGNKIWKNDKGQYHRIDGPAIEFADGTKSWYINGQRHREDGPAIECADGSKSWWINGQLYKIDGPAVEYVNGYKEWYINGTKYSEEEFNKKINSELKTKENVSMSKFSVTYYGPSKMSFGSNHFITHDQSSNSYKLFINGTFDKESNDIEVLYDILKKRLAESAYEQKERTFLVEVSPNKISYFAKSRNTTYSLGFILKEGDTFIVYDQYDQEISRTNLLEKAVDDYFKLCSGVKFFRLNRDMFNYRGLISEKVHTDGDVLKFEKYVKPLNINSAANTIAITASNIASPTINLANPAKTTMGNIKSNYPFLVVSEFNAGAGSHLNDQDLKILKESLDKISQKIDKIEKNTSNVEPPIFAEPDYSIIEDIPFLPDVEKYIPDTSGEVYKAAEIPVKVEFIETKVDKVENTTYSIGMSALEDGLKKSAARQGSRIIKDLIKSMLKASAEKVGQEQAAKFLDTEFSDILIELMAPTFAHMLCQRTDLPYKEQIEMVSELALNANITHYTLKYADKSTDFIKSILMDASFRNKMKDAIKIGGAIINSESGSVEELSNMINQSATLDLEKILDKELA